MQQPGGARRRFLRLLAASPLAAPAAARALAQHGPERITSPEQALNVFDFEAAAERELPRAHFGYLATGVDDDATLRANRAGFQRFQLRVRRLVDVREVDLSVSLLGARWAAPVVLAPVGSQRAFHSDGEIAVARAARSKNQLQILSTTGSTAVEDVTAARGGPIWYQLYPTDVWAVTRALLKRAESAGCPAVVLTVDLQGGSNRETLARAERSDTRQCSACHRVVFGSARSKASEYVANRPMFRGLDVSAVTALVPPGMTWDYIKRLRDTTTMQVLLKGIVTREDAELAVEHGAAGVIVSNHGGRAEESGRATIESLPEVVEGVKGRVPVIVDGGFRRGTDIFKALALGAAAVAIGRPYVWGLAAFGQPGVEAVLDLLQRELRTVMRQAGTRRVAEITRGFVVDRG
jgi:isopentenyl diphosphate isomerase/L-lactate dehydrogenase-like FMN-dependent dehydrogenase